MWEQHARAAAEITWPQNLSHTTPSMVSEPHAAISSGWMGSPTTEVAAQSLQPTQDVPTPLTEYVHLRREGRNGDGEHAARWRRRGRAALPLRLGAVELDRAGARVAV